MPQRNTELKITQSPTFVWRYDSTSGADDEGWCTIFLARRNDLGQGVTEIPGTRQNLITLVNHIATVQLGVPDLQGNDAFVTLDDANDLFFTIQDLSNPSQFIEFSLSIDRITEARTISGNRPYINVVALTFPSNPNDLPTVSDVTVSDPFNIPQTLDNGGVVSESLLDAHSVTVVRGRNPMTFNVWAEIDSETESIGVIALGTDTQAEATNEITCIVRYDPRIRASFKAELDGITYIISRVEQIERYRFLRIGLSSFDASRA